MIIIREKINIKNLCVKIQEIKENITVKYNSKQQYMIIHEKNGHLDGFVTGLLKNHSAKPENPA